MTPKLCYKAAFTLGEKDDATLAAWRAPGVTRVENKLQVQF